MVYISKYSLEDVPPMVYISKYSLEDVPPMIYISKYSLEDIMATYLLIANNNGKVHKNAFIT